MGDTMIKKIYFIFMLMIFLFITGCNIKEDKKDELVEFLIDESISDLTELKELIINNTPNIEKLQTMFNQLNIVCKVFENSKDAIKMILRKIKADRNLVLVTGSFYLVSDVVSQLSVSK